MEGSEFDEEAFFRAVATSGGRALLIGRRALIVLGLPVLTGDYDFWLHVDDIERFNGAAAPFGLVPTRTPDESRIRGRYGLENDEKVDVLVGRFVPTIDGETVLFDEVWAARQSIEVSPGILVAMPCLEDLARTKRFGARPKDVEDLRLIAALIARREKS
jgi:hypothetical protein